MAAFLELGLLNELADAVKKMDWNLPTDIQQDGIPTILGGGDVLMAAETGSGKTGAFCLPIIQIVWETIRDVQMSKKKASAAAKRPSNAPICVIIDPTKELAAQTHEQIANFSTCLDTPKLRNILLSGGRPAREQIDELNAHGADIVTCTPGRVIDLVKQNALDLEHVRFYVLDEADSLIANSQDSLRVVRDIHAKIPRYSPADGSRLQMIVCSATLHNFDVSRVADELMHFPQWIDLKGQDSVSDTVHHVVCMVDPVADKSWIRLRSDRDANIKTDGIHAQDGIRPGSSQAETLSEGIKVLKLAYLIRAIEEHKMDKGIIFCRTKLDCDHAEQFLRQNGQSCVCLHGDRSPDERQKNLHKFNDDEVAFLICTDVAARGLDVTGVPYVFNVTLPPTNEKANYVHRIGRVGRAERMGLAISLVATAPEKVWYHQCKSKGANCHNTTFVNRGGCVKWFNETEALGAIEDHLGVTVPHIATDFAVPVFEYEGKVTYGGKRTDEGLAEFSHADVLAPAVRALGDLEREVQLPYLQCIG